MVDMATSDGRFLFFLPWLGHTIVGTTDRKEDPTMTPLAQEDDIQWVINEASKYLSPELKVRRKDVLSAWAGIRPLAVDPNASDTASASRDHVVSHNEHTGVVFVAGGKWTTYREMAEDGVDKVGSSRPRGCLDTPCSPCPSPQCIEVGGLTPKAKCSTLEIPLRGRSGCGDHACGRGGGRQLTWNRPLHADIMPTCMWISFSNTV